MAKEANPSNIRSIGSRGVPEEVDHPLSPAQWLIQRANADAIATIQEAISTGRHVVVLLRSPDNWRAAGSDLLRHLLGGHDQRPIHQRSGVHAVAGVVEALGYSSVLMTLQPSDGVPIVYQRLAVAEVDVGRVRSEHVDSLTEDRWPDSADRWPSGRDVLSIPSAYLSTAFYQASSLTDALGILDAIAAAESVDEDDVRQPPTIPDEEKPKTAALKKSEPEKAVVDDKMRKAIAAIAVDHPTSPLVADLAGYGIAAHWAEDLATDIQSYFADEIPFSDVDRGCLLVGPPGTGKTLFAKAAAATTSLPLIATSYAQWQSAGTGHLGDVIRSIRATFGAAEIHAPCILFIDEIDTVRGRCAGGGDNDGWWTAITTCLLECLDGIGRIDGIITIGACNHAEGLDPALLRSGRLDRRFEIGLPDEKALSRIFRHHLPDLDDETITPIATSLAGTISGADVARIAREARREARRRRGEVDGDDLMAIALPADDRTPEMRRLVAVHEAGHAVAMMMAGKIPVSLSIVKSGDNHGGVRGDRSLGLGRIRDIETEVIAMLAGRAAEEVILGFPSGGAGGSDDSDLGTATRLLAQVDGGLGLGTRLSMGTPAGEVVEAGIRRLYAEAVLLVVRQRRQVIALAELALEKRVVGGKALAAFAREHGLEGGR